MPFLVTLNVRASCWEELDLALLEVHIGVINQGLCPCALLSNPVEYTPANVLTLEQSCQGNRLDDRINSGRFLKWDEEFQVSRILLDF